MKKLFVIAIGFALFGLIGVQSYVIYRLSQQTEVAAQTSAPGIVVLLAPSGVNDATLATKISTEGMAAPAAPAGECAALLAVEPGAGDEPQNPRFAAESGDSEREVILLAASNRPEILMPLLRSGRFGHWQTTAINGPGQAQVLCWQGERTNDAKPIAQLPKPV